MSKPKKKFKILLLGDSSVGKTSLLVKFTEGTFSDEVISTLGIDYKVKIINLNGEDIQIDLWDTAGQERFKSIAKNYFKGANGFFFVYDITKKSTFEGMKHWIKEAEKNSGKFKYVICGNKCDLKDNREVPFEDLEELGERFGSKYFETSAKEDINVKEAFNELVKAINQDFGQTIADANTASAAKVELSDKKTKNNGGCCKK